MGIIGTLILGLVIGVIAKAINRGPEPGGILGSIIVGVLGALVGSWIATLFDSGLAFPPEEFFNLTVWVFSIIGALIVLFVYKLLVGRGGGTHRTATR